MPRELFQVVEDRGANILELSVPSTADVSEFDRLNQAALAELDLNAEQGWILDMSRSTYVGSAALGFMINVRQRVKKAEGLLVLCGVSGQILSTLRASSLGRLFMIVDDRSNALAAISDWQKSRRRAKK